MKERIQELEAMLEASQMVVREQWEMIEELRDELAAERRERGAALAALVGMGT